tara:strand:+ start:943 stop:2106 length:1164 start_codon:yes stop_codon:yes gene_type:complete
MKKSLVILGSTGSIGKSLLNIIAKDRKNFNIILLSANKNYRQLINQTKKFNVKNVIINNEISYEKFKKYNKNKKLKIYKNFDNLHKIFNKKIDYTMSCIVGLDGLEPTFKIIKYTKKIAIANKETLICAWDLILNQMKKNNTEFVPVDSEHFSIWYSLKKNNNQNIDKIYLTASGGPLLNISKKKFNSLKIKDVIKHPNWSMGKKISVDSSTMMNKVFEIIEAKNMFNVGYNNLYILLHPKSYVHAIIQFKGGMTKIVAHPTTMEIPIFNSLYDDESKKIKTINLDIAKLNDLNLTIINNKKFPLVNILKTLPNRNTLFETVIVSANDALVDLYLVKKINYTDIIRKMLSITKNKEFIKMKKKYPRNISDIINLSKKVRNKIYKMYN